METSLEKKSLTELLYQVLRIRMIEEAIAHYYPEQEMRCPVHLSIGQESVAVGVCQHLRPQDRIISGHRAHAHYLAKGGSLKRLLAEIYGKETGCCSGKGGSMHLIDLSVGMYGSTPIVGGSFPVAVGLALAAKMQKQDLLTVVFFGEGMTEEGVFFESLNFASLKNLPILFVCENNLYSVYSPLSVRQSRSRDLLSIVKGHGIKACAGRGNDAEEVSKLTLNAIDEIKKTDRPFLLEFSTYRYREHCGPNLDNHLGYREQEEVKYWEDHCPIKVLKEKMFEREEFSEKGFFEMKVQIENEIKEAFQFAKESPFPKIKKLESQVYAL